MKPTCKLCETKHWTWDEHQIGSALDKTRELGASVLRNTAVKVTLPANKASLQTAANTELQTTCECGKPTRPRGTDCWKCYRERSK